MEEEKKENIVTEEKKKSNEALSIFANYIFWVVIILFLESVYRISMGIDIVLESSINILLYTLILSSFLSIFSRIFKDKVNNVITAVILFALGILFSVQCVFTKIFKTNFALSNLALGDQAAGFMGDALERNI